MESNMKVAILGASHKPDRYSFKANQMLQEYHHEVFQIFKDQKLTELLGQGIDTLTLYVNPQILEKELNDIVALNPRRVIFNPGTEDKRIEKMLQNKGIHVVEACTLVLLRTSQFDKA